MSAQQASLEATTTTTTTIAVPQTSTPVSTPLWRALAPICAMVFAEFLAMGLPLPVLPHRVGALGFGTFVVGLVIGAQAWGTLFTRHAAGVRTDAHGPRRAAFAGLLISAIAAGLHAASVAVPAAGASVAVLLIGRGLLGIGESLVITSALAWGAALAGRARLGLVMAWVGIAMYGALALGAPLGVAIDAHVGFVGVALAATLAPLAGLGAALRGRPVAPAGGARAPFREVVRHVWLPGAGLALSSFGFGAIAAFASALFAERGWPHAALAMTAFGGAFVLARLAFGGLPDRLGGARVAAGATAIATVGQAGMWLAGSGVVAVAAAALTGFGASLAFPSFGIEAMKRVPPQNRGSALGAYTACFDLTMGIGVPVLGLLVGTFGIRAAFAAGTLASAGALAIALRLARRA